MIISILGTRGGIGSTTLLSNLYQLIKEEGKNPCWFSLTAPFPPLFSQNNINWKKIFSINRNIPVFDKKKCNSCNECISFCVYNAIEHNKEGYKILSHLCNSCGLCVNCCKQSALDFILTDIGGIYSNQAFNNNFLKLGLNEDGLIPNPIVTEWHISKIYNFLKKKFNYNEMCFIDIPSGYKELWNEIFKLSDLVVLYTDDIIVWDLIYNSHVPHYAKLILAVNEISYNEFLKFGYSFAVSVPYNKEIAINSIQGKIVKDLYYYNCLQTINQVIKENIKN